MPRKNALRKVSLIRLLVMVSNSQAGTVAARSEGWTSLGFEGGSVYALLIDPLTLTIL